MPSWRELKRFCDVDGWEMYRKSDHYYYRKTMPDGSIKRTKVSMVSGEIGSKKWENILKDQLEVSQQYFNSKV